LRLGCMPVSNCSCLLGSDLILLSLVKFYFQCFHFLFSRLDLFLALLNFSIEVFFLESQ